MYEFDRKKVYRLLDVRDHDGRSKIESRLLYVERVGCIAKNIQTGHPYPNGSFCMHADFFQDGEGRWINRALRTSLVSDIKENAGTVEIYTHNSIYVFEPVDLPEPNYLDEAELIELYLSNEPDSMFCMGFYYDQDKKPHNLECYVHAGMLTDSCLIQMAEEPHTVVCRYYPDWCAVRFYDTLYEQQDYSRKMLIRNVGSSSLRVSFDGDTDVCKIEAGEGKMFNPVTGSFMK